MNFKKFISGISALTIAASAFAGLAVTANAASTPVTGDVTSGATYKAVTLDNYATGDCQAITLANNTNIAVKASDGTQLSGVAATAVVNRLTDATVAVREKSASDKYLEISLTSADKTGTSSGTVAFGGRAYYANSASDYQHDLGRTRIATVDAKFISGNDIQILFGDVAGGNSRSYYNGYTGIVYNGQNTLKSTDSSITGSVDTSTDGWYDEWHTIVVVDKIAAEEVNSAASHTVYLYVDGQLLGSKTLTRNGNCGASNMTVMHVAPNSTGSARTVLIDNYYSYLVGASSSNTISITGDSTKEKGQYDTATVTYTPTVLHNTTDNVDISCDTYNTNWTVTDENGDAVTGASISDGVLTLDENYPTGTSTLKVTATRGTTNVSDTKTLTVTNNAVSDENYYTPSFTVTDSENSSSLSPTIKVYEDETEITDYASKGLQVGTYTYEATLADYDMATGSFTIQGTGDTTTPQNVAFTMNEAKYSATFTTLRHAKVDLAAGTSTSQKSVAAQTAYSGYTSGENGTVTLSNLYVGTYNITVTKGGYTTGAGTLTVASGGSATYSSTITPEFSDDDVLFYEDFATTGISEDGYGVFGGYRYRSGNVTQTIWRDLKGHTLNVPFATTSAYGTEIEIDKLKIQLGVTNNKTHVLHFNDTSGNPVITITASGVANGKGSATITGSGDSANTVKLFETTYDDEKSAYVATTRQEKLSITVENNVASISYGNYNSNVNVSTNTIASFTVVSQNSNNTVFEIGTIKAVGLEAPATANVTNATATWVKDYTSYTDTDTEASVWALTLTFGDNSAAVNSIALQLNNGTISAAQATGTDISSGTVTFATVINKLKADVTSLAAYFNGGEDATNVTVQ